MPTVYILRGLPGSGKSTFAKSIAGAVICSADDYFMHDGKYLFDARLLSAAHAECKAKFRKAIFDCEETIIVDNTNTTAKEYIWYLRSAEQNGYSVVVKNFKCSVEYSFRRNTHNVPRASIERMAKRLEK